jgi:hypothetical protein
MSDSYSSSSYYYSSTINRSDGATTTGHRHTTTSHTDKDGTTVVRSATQDLGQPAIVEERIYDRTGQEKLALGDSDPGTSLGTSAGGVKRITDLDEEGATGLDITNAYGPAQLIDESTSYDLDTNAVGVKNYDPITGAYDEHMDYDTPAGSSHHREVRDAGGRMFRQDFDIDSSGLSGRKMVRKHDEYENPNTGVRLAREDDVDVSDVI